jgi:uncharacterized protein
MTATFWTEYGCGRRYLVRLPPQEDLLLAIAEFCKSASIQMAVFSLVGTVTKVSYGCFDPKQQVYVTCKEESPFEIVACSGNVCPAGDQRIVQAHGVLSNEHGTLIAGRLFSDTILLAGELDLQELKGRPLQRVYDHATGLLLWQLSDP